MKRHCPGKSKSREAGQSPERKRNPEIRKIITVIIVTIICWSLVVLFLGIVTSRDKTEGLLYATFDINISKQMFRQNCTLKEIVSDFRIKNFWKIIVFPIFIYISPRVDSCLPSTQGIPARNHKARSRMAQRENNPCENELLTRSFPVCTPHRRRANGTRP